uniref:Protein longifolia 1-like n=1 Tax=Tanacetum cinerariifolium TaxID=118510 RepID=A0A6L2NCL4_TANCI|nr:protein longifolia 1-like [Tanacetum cinerariifolium]
MNESRRSILMKQVQGGAETETSYDPGSNKRLTSVVVARLMGLESLTDFSSEVETSKIMTPLNDHPISRLSRNGDEYKQSHGFVSPRVYLNIKLASQQQEDNDDSTKKTSVYGGMEKRSSALEFKISRKYLRAHKQKQCKPQEECWKTKGNHWIARKVTNQVHRRSRRLSLPRDVNP